MFELQKLLHKFLPKWGYNAIRILWINLQIFIIKFRHSFLVKSIGGKTKIKVVFLVYDRSVWKCEGVYDAFARSDRYEVSILVCPIINIEESESKKKIEECFKFFSERQYKVHLAEYSRHKLDDADIVFFTNPHNITKPEYYNRLFFRKLCCYIPYSHQISNYDNNYAQYNRPFHNLMWKIFAPQDEELELFKEFSVNKGKNVVISGYPGVEQLLENSSSSLRGEQAWKAQSKCDKKKIIWAPHHTVHNAHLKFSNFYSQADLILSLSDKYKEQTQWCFKPHPLLFSNLMNDGVWSEDKIVDFYNIWQKSENKQLELGAYIDIFKQSDAMIHDSGSFLAEYLYLNKPVMHLAETEEVTNYLNDFGISCYNVCSKNNTGNLAIEPFIKDVINNIDRGFEDRNKFVELLKQRYFPSINSPSNFIFNHINSYFVN
ncbi:CDP-glycerol glycerophosphotransferase family protein [Shewanella algae]|uniref:CDP-glycerol glycerophosphotransferase family protein n=1 Tax=Shewanella algae TaxID=38313 RepID=UPI001AAD8B23|nr:CDP-glycerol glycerophosphotransferase family protein [Shewanella algae]